MDEAAPEHRWEIIDAVGRSPLLGPPSLPAGIDLGSIERWLLDSDALPAGERERLIVAVRELASVYANRSDLGVDDTRR